ncbi:Rdx family protein [Halomarina litorea]|uniref:Rdx family protein n=1 Tax=Halomarina litorea TaxID=2961595 RepID=UPI0020C4431F|nr:Rdx family protein [Halomarina sp. BCD28]
MTTVEIEYCVPCGLRENALTTADRLLAETGRALDDLRLIPGDSGVFTVAVDGEIVFDKDEQGYDIESIVEAVTSRATA